MRFSISGANVGETSFDMNRNLSQITNLHENEIFS